MLDGPGQGKDARLVDLVVVDVEALQRRRRARGRERLEQRDEARAADLVVVQVEGGELRKGAALDRAWVRARVRVLGLGLGLGG